MSLNDLANSTEAFQVNNAYGWGVDVVFTPRSSGVPEPTRGFSKAIARSKTTPDFEHIEDRQDFLSVVLSAVPKRLDTITYLSTTWLIEAYAETTPGMYDLYCFANRRDAIKRTARMR